MFYLIPKASHKTISKSPSKSPVISKRITNSLAIYNRITNSPGISKRITYYLAIYKRITKSLAVSKKNHKCSSISKRSTHSLVISKILKLYPKIITNSLAISKRTTNSFAISKKNHKFSSYFQKPHTCSSYSQKHHSSTVSKHITLVPFIHYHSCVSTSGKDALIPRMFHFIITIKYSEDKIEIRLLYRAERKHENITGT